MDTPEGFLKSYAHQWRCCHTFIGPKPDTHPAMFFLLQLFKIGSQGGRFVIKTGEEMLVRLSDREYEEHMEWYLVNLDSIYGTETHINLKFKTGFLETFSADRWVSSLAADAPGQERICDGQGYNRLMSPSERISFTNLLLNNYNPHVANAVIDCYLEGCDDVEANERLAQFGVGRKSLFETCDVPKWAAVFRKQKCRSSSKNWQRFWTVDEMKEEWRLLCCICLVTGIPGSKLDLNWDRIWDLEGWYQKGDVVSMSVRINDACAAHPAFKTRASFEKHIKDIG